MRCTPAPHPAVVWAANPQSQAWGLHRKWFGPLPSRLALEAIRLEDLLPRLRECRHEGPLDFPNLSAPGMGRNCFSNAKIRKLKGV